MELPEVMEKQPQQRLTNHLLKNALDVGLAGNIGDSFAKQVLEEGNKNYVLRN